MIVLLLGLLAPAAAAAPAPPAPPAPAVAAAIRCGSDNCAALLADPLPADLSRIADLGGRKLDDLEAAELCRNVVFPAIGRTDETPESLCGKLFIKGSYQNYEFHEVVSTHYEPFEPRPEQTSWRFQPNAFYADKLRAFVPCFSPFELKFREKGYIPTISTYRHPFFEEDPEREDLFSCGYRLSGYAAPPHYFDFPLPEWSSPIGVAPIDSEHVALVLARLRDIQGGAEILGHLQRLADSAGEREHLCGKEESCWAPRRLRLEQGPFDEAIAYCAHDLVEGEYQLPGECHYAALRVRTTGEWLIRALISPDTAFPSGNGIGDADISCERKVAIAPLDLLRRKFSPAKGYRISGEPVVKVIRKGQPSEVYTNWREYLVISVVRQGNHYTLNSEHLL